MMAAKLPLRFILFCLLHHESVVAHSLTVSSPATLEFLSMAVPWLAQLLILKKIEKGVRNLMTLGFLLKPNLGLCLLLFWSIVEVARRRQSTRNSDGIREDGTDG